MIWPRFNDLQGRVIANDETVCQRHARTPATFNIFEGFRGLGFAEWPRGSEDPFEFRGPIFLRVRGPFALGLTHCAG